MANRKEEAVTSFVFPSRVLKVDVDDRGCQAHFYFRGAHTNSALAALLNSRLEEDPNLCDYQIIVTENTKDVFIVLGPGGVSKTRFKAARAAIKRKFASIAQEEINQHRTMMERLRDEATASPFEGRAHLQGSIRS